MHTQTQHTDSTELKRTSGADLLVSATVDAVPRGAAVVAQHEGALVPRDAVQLAGIAVVADDVDHHL